MPYGPNSSSSADNIRRMMEMMEQGKADDIFNLPHSPRSEKAPIDGYGDDMEVLDTPDGLESQAQDPRIDIGPMPDMRRPMPLPEYGEGPPRNALTQRYKGFVPGIFGHQPAPQLPKSNTPGGVGMFGTQQGGSAFPY